MRLGWTVFRGSDCSATAVEAFRAALPEAAELPAADAELEADMDSTADGC